MTSLIEPDIEAGLFSKLFCSLKPNQNNESDYINGHFGYEKSVLLVFNCIYFPDGDSKKRRPPPEVCIESDEIEVSAVGVGAQSGPSNYHFVLEFYLPVDTEKSSYQVRDNGIQITLVKKERDWWPRLIYQQHKLPWLKIDFDRWRDVDDETGLAST